jgi:hypothetical protein
VALLYYYYYFAMVYQCYLESWSPRSVSSITRPIIATKPHPHPPTPFFVFICCLLEGTYSLPYYFAQLFSRLIGPTCSGFVCMLAKERKKKKETTTNNIGYTYCSSSPHPSCLVVSALFHFFFTHTIIITIFLLFVFFHLRVLLIL